jgi:outer membrane lipoprotein carrier protein
MSKGLPAGIELHDNFGNVILVTLSKIQVNTSLSAKTFKFVPPAGADVLKVQ